MALEEEVLALRRATDEPTSDNYSDLVLSERLDADLDFNQTASAIWREKAAAFSTLINVSESGSSRSMGDLYKNALAFANHYSSLIVTEEQAVAAKSRVGTRAIERP